VFRKVIQWFEGKKVNHKVVDAVADKEVRQELTKISGKVGNYPQVFVTTNAETGDGETKFVGQFEEIEQLIELEGTDQAILEQNPGLKTFSQVFGDCMQE